MDDSYDPVAKQCSHDEQHDIQPSAISRYLREREDGVTLSSVIQSRTGFPELTGAGFSSADLPFNNLSIKLADQAQVRGSYEISPESELGVTDDVDLFTDSAYVSNSAGTASVVSQPYPDSSYVSQESDTWSLPKKAGIWWFPSKCPFCQESFRSESDFKCALADPTWKIDGLDILSGNTCVAM